jgi:hypothetical protein
LQDPGERVSPCKPDNETLPADARVLTEMLSRLVELQRGYYHGQYQKGLTKNNGKFCDVVATRTYTLGKFLGPWIGII